MENKQSSNVAAFCALPGFLVAARHHPLRNSLCRPITYVSSRGAPVRYVKLQPRANMPGNIEDLPLELIPQNGAPMPMYWSRPGVYGVYAADNTLQYVAAVENVAESMRTHVAMVADPQRVYAVRMVTVDNVEDAPLAEMAQNWVLALANNGLPIPVGNLDEGPEWRLEMKPTDVAFSGSIVAGDADSRVEAEIKTILRSNRIVLFMKGTRSEPKCGFSKAVVDILSQQIANEFVCVDCLDAAKNPGLREGIKSYSAWPTIPQLYVNGDFVGGADIVQGMVDSGELAAVLHS